MTISIIPFYKKLNKYEISCVLFEKCNLKCKFCFEHDRSAKIDIDYIKSLPQIIIDNLHKTIVNDDLTINHVNIMFWGGEVFMDGLDDGIFHIYRQLMDDIEHEIHHLYPKMDITFSWLSNGVFMKTQRVVNLLTDTNHRCILGFSYDPVDRFSSKKQEQLMIDNVKAFADIGILERISITLTKPNIEALINDISVLLLFQDLGINIDVNYYIANPNWQTQLPTDELLTLFFKTCISNKLFNIIVLEKVFWMFLNTNIEKHCDCHQCSQITKGVWSVDCAKRSSSLSSDQFYGSTYASLITEENTNPIKASLGILKRGCLTCEYHEKCQMPCWISILFNQYQCTSCPYYNIAKMIENDDQILKDYINVRGCDTKYLWVHTTGAIAPVVVHIDHLNNKVNV